MADTALGAPSRRLTTPVAFESCNPAGELLFEVRAGVPAVDALEMASCYMAAARDATERPAVELSENGFNDRVWGAFYLIKMAKAALDAATGVVFDEDRDHE